MRTGPGTDYAQLRINDQKQYFDLNQKVHVTGSSIDKNHDIWYRCDVKIGNNSYEVWTISEYITEDNSSTYEDNNSHETDNKSDEKPAYTLIDIFELIGSYSSIMGYDGGGVSILNDQLQNDSIIYKDSGLVAQLFINHNTGENGVRFIKDNKFVTELFFNIFVSKSQNEGFKNGDRYTVELTSFPGVKNTTGYREKLNDLGYDIERTKIEYTVSGLPPRIESPDKISKADVYDYIESIYYANLDKGVNSLSIECGSLYYLRAKETTVTDYPYMFAIYCNVEEEKTVYGGKETKQYTKLYLLQNAYYSEGRIQSEAYNRIGSVSWNSFTDLLDSDDVLSALSNEHKGYDVYIIE